MSIRGCLSRLRVFVPREPSIPVCSSVCRSRLPVSSGGLAYLSIYRSRLPVSLPVSLTCQSRSRLPVSLAVPLTCLAVPLTWQSRLPVSSGGLAYPSALVVSLTCRLRRYHSSKLHRTSLVVGYFQFNVDSCRRPSLSCRGAVFGYRV